VIGISKSCAYNEFLIGDNVKLGANSCIIGPLTLGDNVEIGASACVTKSFYEMNTKLVGVPAKTI
jgi:serine acetyltransferase